MFLRPLRFTALAAGLAVALFGCASIFGFEEGGDYPDSGLADAGAGVDTDAVRAESPDGERPADAGVESSASGIACGAASLCVPQPPTGWQGPYAIIEASGSPPLPSLPSCPTQGYSQDVYDGMGDASAPPASCTCACGAGEGGTCSPPTTLDYVNPKASCGACSAAVSLDAGCTPLNIPGSQCTAASIGGGVAAGGACPPLASVAVPAVQWHSEARLCGAPAAPAAGACSAGAVCAPVAASPVKIDTYCVATNEVSRCPSAYYTVSRLYYWGGTDSRGCAPCTCGPLTGSACAASAVVTYSDVACTMPHGTLAAPVACNTMAGVRAIAFDGGVPSGGSCVPDGGGPVGDFMPTNPYTICCNQ
jgi:hypothetical protein